VQDKIGTVIGHRHRDGFEATMGKLLVEPDQARHLTDADHTACGPEIHQHHLASQTRLAQALAVDQRVGDRRRPLRWEPEAPAQKTRAGQQGQHHESSARPA